ncbi:nuclear transport factor 2 family protein [Parasphingorhabdus sp.]|uniref:nuclear transport factor 2 family protein n=1 Tax=Parasphingorhabdus sp. TaxID=2709688 RepID=UPI003A8CB1B7
MNTENLARAYYRKVNAKDIEGLLALFADDARFVLPDGRIVAGMDAIRTMYEGVFAQGGPQPQPVAFVPGENGVAAEIEVHLADGTVRQMASFFHVDDEGKFTSIGVYQRTGG